MLKVSKGLLSKYRWFPELALFQTEEERQEIHRRFWRERYGRFGGILRWVIVSATVLGSLALATLALLVVRRVLISRGIWDAAWEYPVLYQGTVLLMLLTYIAGTLVLRRNLRRYYRAQLVAKGVPICIDCGYDLRGQVDPRCPECGKAFDPKLLRPSGDPGSSCAVFKI